MNRTIRKGDRVQAERVCGTGSDHNGKAFAPLHWGTVREVYGRVLRVEWDDGHAKQRRTLIHADGPMITAYHDGKRGGASVDISVSR